MATAFYLFGIVHLLVNANNISMFWNVTEQQEIERRTNFDPDKPRTSTTTETVFAVFGILCWIWIIAGLFSMYHVAFWSLVFFWIMQLFFRVLIPPAHSRMFVFAINLTMIVFVGGILFCHFIKA